MTTPVEQRQKPAEMLAKRGFAVVRAAVPDEAVDLALRHIHLDLVQNGASTERLSGWLWGTDWFPHLKWDPPIAGLAWWLPEELRDGEVCDPQIVLQPPDDCGDEPIAPHVDRLPEWAGGREYLRIVGIALTASRQSNGGLLVWPFDRDEPEPVELEPGDAVVMHPRLPHASGLNREGGIRYVVYFRFLAVPA